MNGAKCSSGFVFSGLERYIFKDFYGYKVLTKGKILQETEDGEFTHDCATLKGMSGAPILDAKTLEVIGIHVRGKRYERNIGVPIDLLKELWEKQEKVAQLHLIVGLHSRNSIFQK